MVQHLAYKEGPALKTLLPCTFIGFSAPFANLHYIQLCIRGKNTGNWVSKWMLSMPSDKFLSYIMVRSRYI